MKNLIKKISVISIILVTLALQATAAELPLRSTFEGMGYEVQWQENEIINLLIDDLKIECAIESDKITANNLTYKLDKALTLKETTSYIDEEAVELINNITLYNRAVIDSIIADADEVLPLKELAPDTEVLIGTWHRYPDSYKYGDSVTIDWDEVWVFLAEEAEGKSFGEGENLTLRFEQLLGLPPKKGYTHFSLMRVNSSDLFRPAFENDIAKQLAQPSLTPNAGEAHKLWMNGNSIYSYQQHKYPWTRLGYTLDWADNGTEYGFTEFVLKKGSTVQVEKTYTNDEFFALFKN